MYFEKALAILGLSASYTETDLKRAYHKLMIEYHPDMNIGKSEEELRKAEEKAKDINAAYEFLMNKRNFQTLDEIISIYHKKLYKYTDFILIHSMFYHYYERIIIIISTFTEQAEKCGSRGKVERLYEESKKKIIQVSDDLCIWYFKKEGIDLQYKEKLNYDCNLEEFYSQLEKIKVEVVTKRIQSELIKYENYKGYEYLKPLIEFACVNNCEVNAKKVGIEEAIKMMHQEIQELFALYFNLLTRLNVIQQEIEKNHLSAKIKEQYDKIVLSFNSGQALADTKKQLDSLEKEIEKEKQYLLIVPFINSFFEQIFRKYNEKILQYQIGNDATKIYSLNNLMGFIIKVFELAKSGVISIDSLKLLEGLTFEDELLDANIMASVYHNLTIVNTSNIYLSKNKSDSDWYVLIEREGKLFLRYKSWSSIKEFSITEQELALQCISLEQFIEEMQPVGEVRNWNKILTRQVLYANKDYMICLKDDNLIIESYRMKDFKLSRMFPIPKEYQDKEYVKMRIIETIQDELDQDMNRSR